MSEYLFFVPRPDGYADKEHLNTNEAKQELTSLLNETSSGKTVKLATILFEMINIAENDAEKQFNNNGTLPRKKLKLAANSAKAWVEYRRQSENLDTKIGASEYPVE